MNSLSRSFLLLLALFPLACRSAEHNADGGVPCTCGTPEADLRGCAHMVCLEGQRNPENADCVCGGLEMTTKGGA